MVLAEVQANYSNISKVKREAAHIWVTFIIPMFKEDARIVLVLSERPSRGTYVMLFTTFSLLARGQSVWEAWAVTLGQLREGFLSWGSPWT